MQSFNKTQRIFQNMHTDFMLFDYMYIFCIIFPLFSFYTSRVAVCYRASPLAPVTLIFTPMADLQSPVNRIYGTFNNIAPSHNNRCLKALMLLCRCPTILKRTTGNPNHLLWAVGVKGGRQDRDTLWKRSVKTQWVKKVNEEKTLGILQQPTPMQHN